jgi:hypothetical protein
MRSGRMDVTMYVIGGGEERGGLYTDAEKHGVSTAQRGKGEEVASDR